MKLIPIPLLLLLKAAIGAVLLALILTRVPLAGAWNAVRQITPDALIGAIALYFSGHAINAAKLRVFLPALKYRQALRFTLLALFYGTALPSQLAGDAVKAVRIARALGGGNIGEVAAAVVLDKVVGLFALFVLTALGLGLENQLLDAAVVYALTAVLAGTTAVLAALILLPTPAWFGRWSRSFRVLQGAHVSAATMAAALAAGLVFNTLSITVFVVLGTALGLKISLAAWAVVVGLTSLVLLLPVTLAGIGLREASLVGLLTRIGQDGAHALALSLALLALTLLGALVGLAVDLLGRDKS